MGPWEQITWESAFWGVPGHEQVITESSYTAHQVIIQSSSSSHDVQEFPGVPRECPGVPREHPGAQAEPGTEAV